MSILLYGWTILTITKRMGQKLDDIYTRMLRAILNRSWRQHPTKQQLYDHLLPITKTIHVRRARHARHCWRSKDELISDILLWTPSMDEQKQDKQLEQTALCQAGCNLENLPEAMDDRDMWRERVREIRADGVARWWWVIHWYLAKHFAFFQSTFRDF